MRLSIDISADEHRKLKALAALSGETIKSYIMNRVLPAPGEAHAAPDEREELKELEAFLAVRIKAVERNEYSTASVSAIFEDELKGA